MSDEKLFADVHEAPTSTNRGPFWLRIGPLYCESSPNRESLQEDADRINAAVEQREAKLRGALKALIVARGCRGCSPDDATFDVGEHQHSQCTTALAEKVLAGAGPDYVPVEQLRAEQLKTKALQAFYDLATGDERYGDLLKAVKPHFEAAGLGDPNATAIKIVERLGKERARLPINPTPRTRARREGEQAAFAMILDVLGRPRRACKVCGDPADHFGRPHSEAAPQQARAPTSTDWRCETTRPGSYGSTIFLFENGRGGHIEVDADSLEEATADLNDRLQRLAPMY